MFYRLRNVLKKKNTLLLKLSIILLVLITDLSGQTIVYPLNGSTQEYTAAKEVRRYIYLRTGQKLEIKAKQNVLGPGDIILVGEDDSPIVTGFQDLRGQKAPEDGFIIKTITRNDRNILVITGSDPVSTLYGVYRFAEHLGIGFNLTSDVIPDKQISLDITGFDEIGAPILETRGILPFHDFPEGPDLWDTDEYMTVISQLQKLGMNFIGLHNYPRWSLLEEKERDIRQGPEPAVWIGPEEEINADGTVNWSYPAYWYHTHQPVRKWGYAKRSTENFHAGASQLFVTNGFGSDAVGPEIPDDVTSGNQVFNRVGEMFKKAFTHAEKLGIKTALGTELTLGIEPAGPEVGEDWIRVMPPELQQYLKDKGKDPADPATIKEIYKGIFTRIKRMHPLDYYQLWTWEGWARWAGSDEQIKAFKDEIQIAYEALEEVNAPFQLGLAGWMLGSSEDPAEFDNTVPPEVPFYGLWDEARGFESLKEERVKWPATWLEEDWGLIQPQLEADRVYNDVKAALEKECDGLIAKHWRTKVVSMNIAAMKDLLWVYGKTGEELKKELPQNKNQWLENFYIDWATRRFGTEVAAEIADIFLSYEKNGNKLPQVSGWDGAPGAIEPNWGSWESEQSKYTFVTEFENLRDKVVGKSNLERFDYWLNTFKSYRLKAQYGTIYSKFDDAAYEENWSEALDYRKEMAGLFEEIMKYEIEKATNVSDLGEIINLEVLNWYQLVQLKWDQKMKDGLGREIPASANPAMEYNGKNRIIVDANRTGLYEDESLKLTARIPGNPGDLTLFYRSLGEGEYKTKQFTNAGRGVYEISLAPQHQDFEYYIDAGNVLFPASAPEQNQTVVIITEPTKQSQTKEKIQVSPNPFVPSRNHDKLTFFGSEIMADAVINIYNKAGEHIKKLTVPAGTDRINWDGRNKSGNQVASGVYVYTLKTSSGKKYVRKFGIIR